MEKKRPYRMSERAKSREETRQKIVEATMHLHEEIGPRATTISAIAERAGVQRLTVYRHFPDEAAVFNACTSHWLSLNPPPDPASWRLIEDPWERLRKAALAFCDYYSATRRIWVASFRDVADVPALQGPMSEFQGFVTMIAADLAGAFTISGKPARRLEATIAHALAFPTWDDLQRRGLDNREKAALAEAWSKGAISS